MGWEVPPGDFVTDYCVTRRNRGGRPPVGPQVKIAIQPDILARVDEAARAAHASRSEWIRRAIVGALPQQDPDAG